MKISRAVCFICGRQNKNPAFCDICNVTDVRARINAAPIESHYHNNIICKINQNSPIKFKKYISHAPFLPDTELGFVEIELHL